MKFLTLFNRLAPIMPLVMFFYCARQVLISDIGQIMYAFFAVIFLLTGISLAFKEWKPVDSSNPGA